MDENFLDEQHIFRILRPSYCFEDWQEHTYSKGMYCHPMYGMIGRARYYVSEMNAVLLVFYPNDNKHNIINHRHECEIQGPSHFDMTGPYWTIMDLQGLEQIDQ